MRHPVIISDRLQIQIKGEKLERVFAIADVKAIRIMHIKAKNDSYTAEISGRDWKELCAACGDEYEVKICRRFGPDALLEHLLQRPGILAGLCCFIFCLQMFGQIVWTIDFGTADNDTQLFLRELLTDCHITEGTLLTDAALAQAQSSLLSQSEHFGWITLNFTGGCLRIETTSSKQHNIRTLDERPLVAAADGTITDVQAESGFCVVAIGQDVKRGALLVETQRIDRDGHAIKQNASGSILARIEKEYTCAINRSIAAEFPTGKQYVNRTLFLPWNQCSLRENLSKRTGYTKNEWIPLQIGRISLPGCIHQVTVWETRKAQLHYARDTAYAMAIRGCRAQLRQEFPDAVIETQIRRSVESGQTIQCTVRYVFRANIARYR